MLEILLIGFKELLHASTYDELITWDKIESCYKASQMQKKLLSLQIGFEMKRKTE